MNVLLASNTNMTTKGSLIKNLLSVGLIGLLFGGSVIFITFPTASPDCGETMAGLGCALYAAQKEIFSNIILLAIAVSVIIIIFNLLQLKHSAVFSVLGASISVAVLSVYSKSYLFYNSLLGSIVYTLLASCFFLFSYFLINHLVWKQQN